MEEAETETRTARTWGGRTRQRGTAATPGLSQVSLCPLLPGLPGVCLSCRATGPAACRVLCCPSRPWPGPRPFPWSPVALVTSHMAPGHCLAPQIFLFPSPPQEAGNLGCPCAAAAAAPLKGGVGTDPAPTQTAQGTSRKPDPELQAWERPQRRAGCPPAQRGEVAGPQRPQASDSDCAVWPKGGLLPPPRPPSPPHPQ